MIYAPKFKCFWVLDCLNLSSKNFPLKGNKELLGFSKKIIYLYLFVYIRIFICTTRMPSAHRINEDIRCS